MVEHKPPNKDSNYRKYYEKDLKFHIKILEKEEAPYKFKIKLFKHNNRNQEEE